MSKEEKKKYWLGEVEGCDLCGRKFGLANLGGIVFIDGRMKSGSWAIMCLECYKENGVGVGVGRGQVYELQRDGEDRGKWLKIA